MFRTFSHHIAFITFCSYIGIILVSCWNKEDKCNMSGQLLLAGSQGFENQQTAGMSI